jgi:S1-C subfamily serine protease
MKIMLIIFLAFCSSALFADSNPYMAESAIYKIEVPYTDGSKQGNGSGVLIAPNKILTNCHVVKVPGWPRVVNRKTGQAFTVTSYYNLGSFDACVLVGGFTGNPVQLADGFQEGENVWIFGYPAGLPSVGQGTVKGLVDTDNGKSILLAAFCAGGSSGGPVINSKGQLVGLNWGVYRYQNQCLSIPASLLRPFLIRT